jgi:predicted Zn-dependent protease with MMP-like domain
MPKLMPRAQFEELVIQALESLPPFFLHHIDNVEVLVDAWPSRADLREAGLEPGETLLGLYYGIPLTERTSAYNLAPPDTITLYQGPLRKPPAAIWRPFASRCAKRSSTKSPITSASATSA